MADHANPLKSFTIQRKQLFSYIFRKIMAILPVFLQEAKAVLRLSKPKAPLQDIILAIFLKMDIPAEASALKRHVMLPLIFGNILLSLAG